MLRWIPWLGIVSLVVVTGASPVRAQEPRVENEKPAAESPGYPIRLDGETLFYVKTALGPITAEERARLAGERWEHIARDPFYSPDLFTVELDDAEGRLYYRGELVGVATAEDTRAFGGPLRDFVAGRVQTLEDAIERYRQRRMPEERFLALLTLAIASLLAAGLIYGTAKLHRRLRDRLAERSASPLVLRAQRLLGIAPEKLLEYRTRGLTLLRRLALLGIAIVYLQVVFSALPMTRGYALAVLQYVLQPVRTLWTEFLAHVGDLFFILVLVVLTHYLLRALRMILREASRSSITLPGVAPEWALPLYKVLRLVVLAIAAVMVYPYIPGSSSAAFKGVSLFAGAVFTLGATSTAANFIGGIVLVFMGAYRLGDRVQIGDVVGDVEEANLLVTRIRTPKNEIVTVPNSSILSGKLVNYSSLARRDGLILHTSVTIGYDAPWRRVHECLLNAARRTQDVLETPEPFVLQTALSDFFVSYELNAHTRTPRSMNRTYSALHQNIQDEFNRAGLQIMSPHYVSDPPTAKIVPPERWQVGPAAPEATPGSGAETAS